MAKLCVIMDPIEAIHVEKDTTVALLLEAQKQKWEIYYSQQSDLFLENNEVFTFTSALEVKDQAHWARFLDLLPQKKPLSFFDVVLMRKDPPLNQTYLYTTYLLELAQKSGCRVINDPTSIRDANEKLFTAWFPQCCPETLVTSKKHLIHDFLQQHQKIIVKALDSLRGEGVFALTADNPNINVTLDLITHQGTHPIMAQRYIPEIINGDKRILMINGEPYPYALARVPAPTDFRGNLAAGAKGIGVELTQRDRWICQQVGPILKKKGLFLVGLDVIGEYLTEINVTSPTGVREIEAAFKVNICAEILARLSEV